MYFLESEIIQNTELLNEVLFLTNNFIAHEYYDHQNVSQFEKSVAVGLHNTYASILQKNTKLNLDNFAWGFSNMAYGLKSYKDGEDNFEPFQYFLGLAM